MVFLGIGFVGFGFFYGRVNWIKRVFMVLGSAGFHFQFGLLGFHRAVSVLFAIVPIDNTKMGSLEAP